MRAAIAAGDDEALGELAYLLACDVDRRDESEVYCLQAIAAGQTWVYETLASILVEQAGRERDTVAACRAAIADGSTIAHGYLGSALRRIQGREQEAEQAFRAAIAAGDERWYELLEIYIGQRRLGEAEGVCREAIERGRDDANEFLAWLLCRQPGREREAEAAARAALAAGSTRARSIFSPRRCSPSRAARGTPSSRSRPPWRPAATPPRTASAACSSATRPS